MKRLGLSPLFLALLAGTAAADMDKNAKKWVETVRPILLPEEEKAYKNLKNNNDAAEFQPNRAIRRRIVIRNSRR